MWERIKTWGAWVVLIVGGLIGMLLSRGVRRSRTPGRVVSDISDRVDADKNLIAGARGDVDEIQRRVVISEGRIERSEEHIDQAISDGRTIGDILDTVESRGSNPDEDNSGGTAS